MAGRRAIITGTLAMPAAQQTCGRVNMQPPCLNIYPSRSFTEMLASAAVWSSGPLRAAQPDDHGGHAPGAGRNVFGAHLVDAPVAEDALDYGRADIVRYRGS
jgi:hypothetical protein